MKKVLIAIDYNPVSEQVAKAGYELAKSLGAEICLLHVIADISYYGVQYPTFMGYEGYDMSLNVELYSEMRKVAEDFLTTAAKHLNDETVMTHLEEGDTADCILEYAEKWGADIVVMGTHSHSVMEKIFMGTVASTVVEKTKSPLYLVPVKKD